jgi:hypothetical protein
VIVSCVCLGKGDSSRAVGQAILIQAQLNQTNDKDAKECKTTKTITKKFASSSLRLVGRFVGEGSGLILDLNHQIFSAGNSVLTILTF